MNTHWNTVCSTVCSSSTSSSRFPGLGFESQSRSFFRFFSFSQLSATVNQWRIFVWITFIDSLIWVVIRVTSQKLPWLGFEPQTWKHGIASTGIRTPDVEKWSCLDWDSNPRPGNMELPRLGFEPQTWKNGVALTGIRTPDLETWNFQWNWACCLTQCSNGC